MYKLATELEAQEILNRTRAWAKQHTMFASATGAGALAAAEFWLNQQGKTLYPHLAKND